MYNYYDNMSSEEAWADLCAHADRARREALEEKLNALLAEARQIVFKPQVGLFFNVKQGMFYRTKCISPDNALWPVIEKRFTVRKTA